MKQSVCGWKYIYIYIYIYITSCRKVILLYIYHIIIKLIPKKCNLKKNAMENWKSMYSPIPPYEPDVTQSQFLRLKSLVCPTIYPLLKGEQMDSYVFQDISPKKMQTVLSRIWNQIIESISYVNKYYAMSPHWKYSYHIYPTPPLGQDMTQGQFLNGV